MWKYLLLGRLRLGWVGQGTAVSCWKPCSVWFCYPSISRAIRGTVVIHQHSPQQHWSPQSLVIDSTPSPGKWKQQRSLHRRACGGCLPTATRSPEQWIPSVSKSCVLHDEVGGRAPHLPEFQCSAALSAAHGDPRSEGLSQFFVVSLLPNPPLPLSPFLPSFFSYIRLEKKRVVERGKEKLTEAQLSALLRNKGRWGVGLWSLS